jgi:hypothetical protein
VASGVTLRVYNLGFGGTSTLLGTVTTAADGAYTLGYQTADGHAANLDIRAVAADGTEVSLASPALAASGNRALDLVAPGAQVAPLANEYQRMITDLTPHLGGAALGSAVETAQRADLSLLSANTGWDSRLIAIGASATALAAGSGIGADALYGMLRAGLPADPAELARVSPDAVTAALSVAAKAGVVSLTEAQITAATSAFMAFARTTRLATVAPGALSSHGQMLAASGVDTVMQGSFDDLYAAYASDPAQLWSRAGAAGLPVDTLQLTGKLGYLTVNNAALTASLRPLAETTARLGDVLVNAGMHNPQSWVDHIKSLGNNSDASIAALIPPAYQGTTTDDRLQAYATDLARKVRLAWPTPVITEMISQDQLRLGAAHDAVKGDVQTFLTKGRTLGYELGSTPVGAFVRQNSAAIFGSLGADRVGAATQAVQTLHRLYQISPDNDAMAALYSAGFTSARQVARVPYEKFVDRYTSVVGSADVARLIWRKARQISSVTYTVFGAAGQVQSSPPMPIVSGEAPARQAAQDAIVAQYPTMAQLFGSLDFCECDDCRSVLSPAAYLVDLLHFLDPDPLTWTGDLTEWAAHHQGATYPYPTPAAFTTAGSPVPKTPYDALTARRPDLAATPLTCENTNTAMPYLDVVNEIMEYAVAHGTIDAAAAHDTGAATSADLIAEPQYVLTSVYDTTMTAATYPLALPFDLRIATVRKFLDHFNTPLWTVLDALRPTDELTPTGTQRYGRRSVYIERLGLAAVDHDLLTTAGPVATWHQLYGYPDAPTALTALASAKTLADRLGVSYVEIVALVKTGFVNPALAPLVALGKLGIDIEDVLRYKGQPGYPAFSAEEQAGFAAKLGGAGAWLDATWAAGAFARALVLQDPDAGCGFDQTVLCHADGTAAGAIDFVLLNYLVRLWRRLGWPLATVDRALTAFLPSTPDPRTDAGIGPAMASALLGLAHIDALPGDHATLVRLWSDLTAAEYADLFLTPGVGAADPVFDQPAGLYLQWLNGAAYQPFGYDHTKPDDPATGNVGLANHLGAVSAALKLTAADIGRVVQANGGDPATAPLSMPVVSTLARYALLARTLHLPVADLIAMIAVTGIDPFTRVEAAPVTDAAHDHPQAQTAAFIDAVTLTRSAGLSVADVDYLCRHVFDPVGVFRGAADAPVAMVATLATGIASIRAQQAVPADALSFTDDLLAQKVALVLPADAATTFMGMWNGTVQVTASLPAAPGAALDPATYRGEAAITVAYDAVRAQQSLTYRGVLTDPEKARLTTAYPAALFGQLLDGVSAQQHTFFDGYLLRQTVGATPTGFLAAGDFDTLFAPPAPGLTDPQLQAREQTRRALIAGALLPYLQGVLIRAYVITTLAAAPAVSASGVAAADAATLVETLIGDPSRLSDRAHPGAPLLDAFTAADSLGATVTTAATSTAIEGYVQVPEAGPYRFFVACAGAGTVVDLVFDAFTDPVVTGSAATAGAELSGFVTLAAGIPYHFVLQASATGGGAVTVAVQGEHLPKGPLDRLTVYPAAGTERIRRATVLLGKALTIAGRLKLTPAEFTYVLGHAADFGLDLSYLPTGSSDDAADHVTVLFGELTRLCGYTSLRAALAADPGDLLDVLAHARRVYPATAVPATAAADLVTDLCTRFGAIIRRDADTVRAAMTALGYGAASTTAGDTTTVAVAAFADERGLTRVWRVLSLASVLGVSPAALDRWATPTPDSTIARDVHDTVKALYPADTWRTVVQPISDALRRARRDALVAYLLNQHGFTNVDQLYEFFLVDPGTEPVVQTSRIRLAISSVQLFIQRCLLNLEPLVSPWAINSDHWQWMKRYRVWQANREIFLWPENWLEPEFRDDKTHLFKALEGDLLQGNLGADDAEAAFMSYLQSLEVLARLDIRSIWVQEATDPASNTLHVLGRTHNAPFKYFYRTYAHGMWTPWVPVTGDIEGDHVVLVVWRGRPHILWVTFMEKKNNDAKTQTPSQLGDVASDQIAPPRIVEVQVNWMEYFQGAWSGRSSGGFGRPIRAQVSQTFDPDHEFVYATVDPSDGAIWVNLAGEIYGAFRIVSKVAPPQAQSSTADPEVGMPLLVSDGPESYFSGDESLAVAYWPQTSAQFNAIEARSGRTTADILAITPDYTVVAGSGPITSVTGELAGLVNPFFYQDERNTFFVQPSVTETTIEEWPRWVIADAPRRTDFTAADISKAVLQAQVPIIQRVRPDGPGDPILKYQVTDPADWVTSDTTRITYGSTLIGATGRDAPVLGQAPATGVITGAGIGAGPANIRLSAAGLAGTVTRAGGAVTRGSSVITHAALPAQTHAGVDAAAVETVRGTQ